MRLMSLRGLRNAILAGFALSGFASAASAQVVYVATGLNDIGTVDLSTANYTHLSTTSTSGVIDGITFSSDGTLFGINAPGGGNSHLFTIDPLSGLTMDRGDTGAFLVGLAYRPSDGVLFADDFTGSLFTVNPLTAMLTPVATIANNGNFGNLTFSPNDTLYNLNTPAASDELYTRNQTNGAENLSGDTGTLFNSGLVFTNNTLFDFDASNNIFNINPATGAGVNTGLTVTTLFGGINAAAVRPNAVPEPGSAALLSGLAVAGAGFVLRRRRRK
jgi:hypothetical protein